jgi:hypothetical protein
LRFVPVALGGAFSGSDSSSASLSDSEEEEEEEEEGEELLLFFTAGASSIETSESEPDSGLDSSLESEDSSLSSSSDDAEEDFHTSYMFTNEGAASLLVPEIFFPLRSFSSFIRALLAEA